MAESLAHKFGQIIGELLELSIEPQLQKFGKQNNLFLDKKGVRSTRKGKKLYGPIQKKMCMIWIMFWKEEERTML